MEVFVAVRVAVRVRVEVPPLPADPDAGGLGREEGEARGDACLAAPLPVGEEVAVVTSWYSTTSTSVTTGTETLV